MVDSTYNYQSTLVGGMNTSMIVQILLASVIVIVLYILTLVVLNIDSIVVTTSQKVKPHETTVILNGYAPVSYLSTQSYNTYNQYADNFIKIGKSVNTKGGAQFSYQFWINIIDPTDKSYKDLILLLKGDKRKYKIGLYDSQTFQKTITLPSKYAIVCPMISFVDSYRHLRVQFGTSKSPLTSIDINMDPNDTGDGRRNLLSLLPINWYLFTFIFEDNYDYQVGAENGINFKFYVNDIPYQENGASSNPELRGNMLRQNDGDLFLLPGASENGSFMNLGNIKYYNYAVSASDIKSTYQSGPPTKTAVNQNIPKQKPAYLSSYNKIDVYNY